MTNGQRDIVYSIVYIKLHPKHHLKMCVDKLLSTTNVTSVVSRSVHLNLYTVNTKETKDLNLKIIQHTLFRVNQ